MFSILLYIMLPLLFLIHDFEEFFTRKQWAKTHYDRYSSHSLIVRSFLTRLKEMSGVRFGIIVAEEFLILCFAVFCAMYGETNVPLIALTWGFNIHLITHMLQAVALKSYVPGLVTSIVLIPYVVLTTADMLHQFTWYQNLLYAIAGLLIVYLNLVVMFSIMGNKHSS